MVWLLLFQWFDMADFNCSCCAFSLSPCELSCFLRALCMDSCSISYMTLHLLLCSILSLGWTSNCFFCFLFLYIYIWCIWHGHYVHILGLILLFGFCFWSVLLLYDWLFSFALGPCQVLAACECMSHMFFHLSVCLFPLLWNCLVFWLLIICVLWGVRMSRVNIECVLVSCILLFLCCRHPCGEFSCPITVSFFHRAHSTYCTYSKC